MGEYMGAGRVWGWRYGGMTGWDGIALHCTALEAFMESYRHE